MNSVRFEAFLASLMSDQVRSAELIARSGISPVELPSIRREEEAAGFWSPASVAYFADRLVSAGTDAQPVVALPTDPGTRRLRLSLSLWPTYDLGVLVSPASPAFYPHFVRRPGCAPGPGPGADFADFAPWQATLEEVISALGAPDADDGWDLSRWVGYRRAGVTWRLAFDIGVLQQVSAVEGCD